MDRGVSVAAAAAPAYQARRGGSSVTMSKLERLRSMGSQELSFRAAVAARVQAQRLAVRARPPRWDRAAVAAAIAPDVMKGGLGEAIAGQDWASAHTQLLERLRA